MRAALKRAAVRGLRALAPRLGYDTLAHAYSPIPDIAPPGAAIWHEPRPLPGIDLRLDAQLDFIAAELALHIAEFSPPRTPEGAGFFLDNNWYGEVDAELLYAMVRRLRPARVLELGAGYSTRVIAIAAAANEREGSAPALTAWDPDTALPRRRRLHGAPTEVRPQGGEDVPLDEFLALAAGDVLFVDTTHVVKAGGEVNRVVLEVMPRLAPGVVVQLHDVYLPYEYPRRFMVDDAFLTEQYLVQALLCENDSWEILVSAHALARQEPERLRALVPTFTGREPLPSALWLRRRAGAEAPAP